MTSKVNFVLFYFTFTHHFHLILFIFCFAVLTLFCSVPSSIQYLLLLYYITTFLWSNQCHWQEYFWAFCQSHSSFWACCSMWVVGGTWFILMGPSELTIVSFNWLHSAPPIPFYNIMHISNNFNQWLFSDACLQFI